MEEIEKSRRNHGISSFAAAFSSRVHEFSAELTALKARLTCSTTELRTPPSLHTRFILS